MTNQSKSPFSYSIYKVNAFESEFQQVGSDYRYHSAHWSAPTIVKIETSKTHKSAINNSCFSKLNAFLNSVEKLEENLGGIYLFS